MRFPWRLRRDPIPLIPYGTLHNRPLQLRMLRVFATGFSFAILSRAQAQQIIHYADGLAARDRRADARIQELEERISVLMAVPGRRNMSALVEGSDLNDGEFD